MKAALILLAVLTLAGCAELGAFKRGVADHGAQAADSARTTAEWTLCNAISVGAWRRAYGADADKAAGWKALCADPIKAAP